MSRVVYWLVHLPSFSHLGSSSSGERPACCLIPPLCSHAVGHALLIVCERVAADAASIRYLPRSSWATLVTNYFLRYYSFIKLFLQLCPSAPARLRRNAEDTTRIIDDIFLGLLQRHTGSYELTRLPRRVLPAWARSPLSLTALY